ncbi:hypothetical protein ACWOFR_01205 [Carnobacterium gallinarum]|uniref:hypothetical protein n=1 Tax=Carnobacterium gallinarum TaxID=2749 RepID=UPI000551DB85|nr:hypothetical protein [Carnobacterium gallinarum]
MKKKWISLLFVSMSFIGMAILSVGSVEAYDPNYVHLENRWNDPYDTTYRIQKWTTSSYVLNITKISGQISAEAWGHSSKAGRTGNVSVANGNTYRISSRGTTYLTNYLVEWYGTGNNAWISDNIRTYGSAYGTWRPDR